MNETLDSIGETFRAQGYCVARGLFSKEECNDFVSHFMELRKGIHPGDFEGVDPMSDDPLKKYPRMIHMHHWDEVSLRFLIDKRLGDLMTEMVGAAPYGVQTMLYFKPPGARGQALHQDQFYLRVNPGTCLAAWLALDDCDEENGCMQLVPETQNLPILCTTKADTTKSFTDVTVPIPDSLKPEPCLMKAGDVLFFNGSIVHGSLPNQSKDRFRRALIAHYATADAVRCGAFYHEAVKFDGTAIKLEAEPMGSECGIWVDVNGNPSVEMREAEGMDLLNLHE